MAPLRSTVRDINDLKDDVADVRERADAVAASAGATSNAVARANAVLADKFGVPGSSNLSFFNSATTLGVIGADLNLLRHANAVMGLTVATSLDVSGGYFRVDGATGRVSMCPHPGGPCSEFNDASGNVHLRAGSAGGYVGIDARAVFGGGSGYASAMPAAVDVGGGVHASGAIVTSVPATAVAGRFESAATGVALRATGAPLKLTSTVGSNETTCKVDGAGGMTVTNAVGAAAPTTVFQIDAANNVTVNATRIRFNATDRVDVSGRLFLNNASIPTPAAPAA